MKPEIFAPGIISTPGGECSCSFSPDGKTVVFGIEGELSGIAFMEEKQGRWTEPQIASFSGKYWDFDLNYSPVGNQVLFSSCRNVPENYTTDVWAVNRTADGWSKAHKIDFPVNTAVNDHHPSYSKTGVLYFHSNRGGGFGERDIYRSRFVNGKYQEAENLGPNINSAEGEGDACISPDEKYLIFGAERPGGCGDYDLYISFRLAENSWTKAVNMGPQINSASGDSCPNISADGKYIFFYSKRKNSAGYPNYDLVYKKELKPADQKKDGDIYWVDARVVEQFRPE